MTLLRRCIFYFVSFVGLAVLLVLSHHFLAVLEKAASRTYQLESYAAWSFVIYMILGMYVGAVIVRQWHVRLNIPLLIFGFLPTLCLNAYLLSVLHIRAVYFVVNMNPNIISLISGFLLMSSLFSPSMTRNRAGIWNTVPQNLDRRGDEL